MKRVRVMLTLDVPDTARALDIEGTVHARLADTAFDVVTMRTFVDRPRVGVTYGDDEATRRGRVVGNVDRTEGRE